MIELSPNEIDILFHIVDDLDCFKEGIKTLLTKDIITNSEKYDGEEDLLKLAGYIISIEQEGDHRNDGQMVDYTIYLTSPENKTTSISTEMCLMVGWNYHKNEIIA